MFGAHFIIQIGRYLIQRGADVGKPRRMAVF